MPTVLCTWELGGGLGHLMNIRPVAAGLARRGYHVIIAARHLNPALALFGPLGIECVQAPWKTGSAHRYEMPHTIAQILHNTGFGDRAELSQLTARWRDLYSKCRPDLLIFDHSPTALLAASACPARRIIIGTGFFCPADETPLRNVRPWKKSDPDELLEAESIVLNNVNEQLANVGRLPLSSLAKLFHQVDEIFLTTLRDLDPYPRRTDAVYRGAITAAEGSAPIWPVMPGKRIYAYLKPFPALPAVVHLLQQSGQPTLIAGPTRVCDYCRTLDAPNIQVAREFQSMAEIARTCDLAVLHGTHGSTLAMLLAGKPSLQIPLYLEQIVNAVAVERIGAGLATLASRPSTVATALTRLLSTDRYELAAKQFSDGYSALDLPRQVEVMVAQASNLANM